MSDERNKLAQMKQRLNDYRRGNAPPQPKPDPNSPHNPYHLPDANMDPSRMPTAADAARAGAGFLQAEMTLQLPMAIFNNLPARMMDDFYQLTWDMHRGNAGPRELYAFVGKMEDHELAIILKEVDSFPLDQLTAGGAKFYEALIEEMERRHPKLPPRRVRVEATAIDASSERLEHPALEAHEEEARALPQRTFPGPLLKPRS
jgi:hypothetical protein